ncbi:lasso peptide biosynthesis B2 protein [Novosphingobium sp. TH158]|uniref:lasso peptide biosynthesis B2 protein n=1 Tax=Novosphingobium sp. TH158 TaxID=2067455 RepID=UPI001304380A|nr:lasso peptide biosynthesis B2 protein [Novosphingobium sp. TH158]
MPALLRAPGRTVLRTGQLALILGVHAAIHRFGLAAVRGLLEKFHPLAPALTTEREAEIVRGLALHWRWVRQRAPSRFRGNCLSQSVTLWWLLRLRGIDTKLCIGIDRRSEQFSAHAWVEHRGLALNAGAAVRDNFATFGHDFAKG